MAAMAVTLNDLKGHSPVAGLFKCNPLNICAAFYTISTDNVTSYKGQFTHAVTRARGDDSNLIS